MNERAELATALFLLLMAAGWPFQREGDEKYSLKVIKTVSVLQMITNETVSENIHKRINIELGKRLEHHLKRLSQ